MYAATEILPRQFDSLEETATRMIEIMTSFIKETSDNRELMEAVLPEDNPAFIKYQELVASGVASIKEFSEAYERTLIENNEDWSEVKTIFWNFLMNQLHVRAETVKETGVVMSNGCLDWGETLISHTEGLSRLALVIRHYQEGGFSLRRHACDSDAAPKPPQAEPTTAA
jgi:hypothetical protein